MSSIATIASNGLPVPQLPRIMSKTTIDYKATIKIQRLTRKHNATTWTIKTVVLAHPFKSD